MSYAEERSELTQDYETFYMTGFSQNRIQLINQVVHYPLTYISNGKVASCESFPLNPEKLKSEKQWDHSKDWQFNITSIDQERAHIAASSTRCRADGSEIETVNAFYVFEKNNEQWERKGSRWKMTCLVEMTS